MSTSSRGDKPQRKPRTMREAALNIVQQLQTAGHAALFAGGCVRDMLMGCEPHDHDVATSATPEEVCRLLRRTQPVGAKFGVILARLGSHAVEVATFRTDDDYEDGRRPVGVQFSNPQEDAQRRDFTINGMFFDPIAEEVVDYVGGRADLTAKLIRAIGEPERRFAEDHLRLLRAVRFAARLGFEIEPATWAAMQHHAAEIEKISPERIRMELEQIISDSHRAHGVKMLHDAGILQHLWPGARAVCERIETVGKVLVALPAAAPFELGLAALLLEDSPREVDQVCAAIRCSNNTFATVKWLVENQDALVDPAALTLADLKLLMAYDAFDDLTALLRAKLLSDGKDLAPYETIRSRAESIAPKDVAPPPLVTGHDLAKMGLKQGPRYKAILDRLYYEQLNEELPDRPSALERARQLLAEE